MLVIYEQLHVVRSKRVGTVRGPYIASAATLFGKWVLLLLSRVSGIIMVWRGSTYVLRKTKVIGARYTPISYELGRWDLNRALA